jgi:glycine/D-amino acid oxidase-like deaminating enzyme
VASPRFDTLIIGQGLVGSALAWHLQHSGQRVLVIDDGHRSAASMVAAGLVNPLAGMRFSRRAQLPQWLDSARRWYAAVARDCAGTIWHPRPMLRLFRSAEQLRFYERLRAAADSTELIGDYFGPTQCPESVAAPFGGFIQYQTGHVDLPRLLTGLRRWLGQHGCLRTEHVPDEAIEHRADSVRVGDVCARRLVFCQGAGLAGNQWFGRLPLNREKGELLTVGCNDWHPTRIVNGAHWLVPLGDGALRFGATHEHHARSATITQEGRDQLMRGLEALVPTRRFTLIDQQAGFRPGTPDRYPMIGQHPQLRRFWLCNGFGARGTLTAPWYTGELARHLVEGRPLPAEADIRRFLGPDDATS